MSDDERFVLKKIITYFQVGFFLQNNIQGTLFVIITFAFYLIYKMFSFTKLIIDRVSGVVPMRVHHYLITKLYLTIRSRMSELGSGM